MATWDGGAIVEADDERISRAKHQLESALLLLGSVKKIDGSDKEQLHSFLKNALTELRNCGA